MTLLYRRNHQFNLRLRAFIDCVTQGFRWTTRRR